MLDLVENTIVRHGMLPPGARVITAVSGGPDSVGLLYILMDVAQRHRFSVAGVAHVNHKLRGYESDQDQELVRRVAASLKLPLFEIDAQISSSSSNIEQGAREARRAFFRALIESGKADRIALGHTRDDQAETVLFRLLRGSGHQGLVGILPVTREGLIRPLLGSSRASVRGYLEERGIPYRIDSSNADSRFARNRLRHGLIPQLEREWNPNLVTNLARLADLALEEERWRASEIERLGKCLLRAGPEGSLVVDRKGLVQLPKAAGRRVLRLALERVRGSLRGVDFHHIESLYSLAAGDSRGRKVESPGVEGIRSQESLLLRPASVVSDEPPTRIVTLSGAWPSPDGKTMIHLALAQSVLGPDACGTLGVEFSIEKVPKQLFLRGWRAGDRYRPVGYRHEHKIKELFQRSRVPSWERPFWPILCVEDQIIWARRFGVAEEFAIGDHAADADQRQRVRVWETPSVPI